MSWGYRPMPQNDVMDPAAVLRDPRFGPAVLSAVQDARLRGYLVDHSVGWDAVDLPLVTSLPIRPKDRAEVNYLIDSANETVIRMVYRQATDNWVQVGKPAYVTSLPSVPTGVDGVEVYYTADDTNGVDWHLRYDSTETTYKWKFVGGPPLYAAVDTDESLASSASYAALTTAGPSITVPLAGDYLIRVEGNCYSVTTAGANLHSYDIGGTGASDNWAADQHGNGLSQGQTYTLETRQTGISASSAIVSKYRCTAGTGHWRKRRMFITPIRVI